jgi:alpha-glucosidase
MRYPKADLRLAILDLEGSVLLEDELGFHWERTTNLVGISQNEQSSKDGNVSWISDKATQMNPGKRLENFCYRPICFSKGSRTIV